MTRVDREGAETHVNQMLRRRASQLAAEIEALTSRLSEPINLDELPDAPGTVSTLGQLASIVRSLAGSEDQQALLDRLLEGASRCFSRSCLFLVRDEAALGWSSVGLADGDGEDPARSLTIALDGCPLLQAARDDGPTVTDDPEKASSVLPPVEPGQRLPRRAMAIPLRVRERVSALLYGDDGGDASEAFDEAAAEILALVASLSAERLVRHFAPDETGPTADVRVALPVLQEHEEDLADPAMEAAEPAPPAHDLLDPEPLEEELEIGSLSLESAVPEGRLSTEETRQHEDARRFARLLVSELLLYHEDSVVAGRRQRDIYQRLKPEIDRSREAYERRVAEAVRSRADYFKEELVRTLALGDPLALGSR